MPFLQEQLQRLAVDNYVNRLISFVVETQHGGMQRICKMQFEAKDFKFDSNIEFTWYLIKAERDKYNKSQMRNRFEHIILASSPYLTQKKKIISQRQISQVSWALKDQRLSRPKSWPNGAPSVGIVGLQGIYDPRDWKATSKMGCINRGSIRIGEEAEAEWYDTTLQYNSYIW